MKFNFTYCFYFLFFLGFESMAQIPVPYTEEFNYDESAYSVFKDRLYDFRFRKQVWTDANADTCTRYGTEECRNYDYEKDIEEHFNRLSWANMGKEDGQSLQITVKGGDHPHHAHAPRTRAEVAIYPGHNEGEEYYYSWSFMIPDNDEFVDDHKSSGYHYIAQWHEQDYISPDPGFFGSQDGCASRESKGPRIEVPFFLRYNHRDDLTQEPTITFLYQRTQIEDYSELPEGYKRYTNSDEITEVCNNRTRIEVPIKKGEWTDITLRIKWSSEKLANYSNTGFMEIWVNGEHIKNPEASNNSIDQYKIFGPNLYKVDGSPLPNFFKVGHYRENHDLIHTLYVDNFRITNDLDNLSSSSHLVSAQCGQKLYDKNNLVLRGHEIPNAPGYKFKIRNSETNAVHYSNNNLPTPEFDISTKSWLSYDQEYKVEIRAMNAGYGEACYITVPSATRVKESYCKQLDDDHDLVLKGYPLPNDPGYKFKVTDLVTGGVKYSNNNLQSPEFDLKSLSSLKFNQEYEVKIRAMNADYGESCIVTTPKKTRAYEDQCKQLPSSHSKVIKGYPVPGDLGYLFKFTNTVTGQKKWSAPNLTKPEYDLNNRSWLRYNEEYKVEVRTMDKDYGKPCYITFTAPSGRFVPGQKPLKSDRLSVMPNPSLGKFKLSSPVSGVIYNSLGMKIEEIRDSKAIDLSQRPVGVYLLKTIEGEALKLIIE